MTGSVSPTVLTNSTYFFCKFQAGTDNLWASFENQIQKQASNMSIEQLARVALALVMNHRPIPAGLTNVLYQQVYSKLGKA